MDDEELLAAINKEHDAARLTRLIHDYYSDQARIDRTPRPVIVAHLAQMTGFLISSLECIEQLVEQLTTTGEPPQHTH